MNSPFRGIERLNEVYFIGIGGIGMSAIARFFHKGGVNVSGYDKTETPLTRELAAEGIAIHYEENIEWIPKKADLVVYTPAIPPSQTELRYYRENGYPVVKRSDVLQIITESSFNICIAGTHGKTTITSMTAHLLRDSGFGCNAFLGGVSVNYGTNFWSSKKNVCVVEADEYDRSFLKLKPDIAVITAMDPDHLDIYGTAEAMEQAFVDFAGNVKENGLLLGKKGLKRTTEIQGPNYISYSLQNKAADVYATNIKVMEGSYGFDVMINGRMLGNMKLNMGGLHNVENAVAAIAIASSLEIEEDRIRKAVESFRGVKRRFEYILQNDRLVFIDDYAHHPEELKALIRGARSMFSRRKCTVVFQPHLYSRTKDLAAGFAEALDEADETILLPIYPARELPVEGVSSEMILDQMKNEQKTVKEKQALLTWIKEVFSGSVSRDHPGVLVMAGAGDIDTLLEPVKEILKGV